jgi:LysM repeat protein
MSDNETPQEVIDKYRRKQRLLPFILGGAAALLVVVGIVFLVVWLVGGGGGQVSLFKTKTPTPTITSTPTEVPPTPTVTQTPTETLIPSPSATLTPSGPFEYTVKENDNCWDIAQQFEVDILLLLTINNFGNTCPINPGDTILIPAPNQEMPTETPIPTDLPRGTKIEYIVKSGDTLAGIASKLGSTVDDIIRETNLYNSRNDLPEITDVNSINAGDLLIVPVYIVTPTPTVVPSSTPRPTTPAAPTATATK